MHEAGIIRAILEIAEKEALGREAVGIGRIGVRIGQFRGVVREALEFSFEVLREGTLAATADLEVETIPLRLACNDCGEYPGEIGDLNFFCPVCGKVAEIVAGREMDISYIELL